MSKTSVSVPKSRSSSKGVPKGWPSDIVYLSASSYSKKLPGEAIDALQVPKSDLPPAAHFLQSHGPHLNVKIEKIMDISHPANGQHGLFASQALAPDSFILPYLGYVHDQTDTDETSDYDLSLDRHLSISVDASKLGNEARFVNDYRGVSQGPNAEFRDVLIDIGNGKVERRIGVFVLCAGKSGKRAKGIVKGQEILVSYGKGFWTERQKALE